VLLFNVVTRHEGGPGARIENELFKGGVPNNWY